MLVLVRHSESTGLIFFKTYVEYPTSHADLVNEWNIPRGDEYVCKVTIWQLTDEEVTRMILPRII